MNFRLCSGLAAIICMSLASCYPLNDGYGSGKIKTGPQKKTTLTPDQLKAKNEEEAKKAAQEEMKKTEDTTAQTPAENPGNVTPSTNNPKPTEQKRNDYSFANKVPGKEGFVFSPYNNKVVDVRDIPSGTLVQDPTYPASEKKYFRVP